MSSDSLAPMTPVTLNWEWTPPELLWIILKKLDIYSLLSCMTVNRRWRDIVNDFIEFHGIWPKVILNETKNMNTIQSYKDVVTNSSLWAKLMLSEIKLHHTYSLQGIRTMNVYKENLIVKTDSAVRYYNLKSMNRTRFYESTPYESDYTENNDMVVICKKKCESVSELHLYGKSDPDDTRLNENFMFVADCVLLYRVEDNICYLVTQKCIVWALMWNGKQWWDHKFRGRYYGNSYNTYISDIKIFNKTVYLVTKFGFVLCEDTKAKRFYKLFRHEWAPRPKVTTNWGLYNQNDNDVSANMNDEQLNSYHEIKFNLYLDLVRCSQTTFYTDHEGMLFVGYKNGMVAICVPKFMIFNEGNPKRMLHVQDFDRSIEDAAILSLGVYEDEMSKHLFVATKYKILHLLFTYPY